MQIEKTPYDKLSRNILLTVITVSLAPLILVGGLIFDQFSSIYREKVYAHLGEVVDKHRDNVDAFLEEKRNEVQYLGRVFSYDQLTNAKLLGETLRNMQRQYGRIFVDLGVVDENGKQVAYAGPFDLLGADYSEADWYKDSRGTDTGISDVFLGLRQSPHFIIACNYATNGKHWTLRATIDFLAFSHLVENIRIGKTGYAYIVNDKGAYQTKLPANHDSSFTLKAIETIKRPTASSDVTVQKSEGSDDEIYITVSSTFHSVNWKLVYQQAESDAFSDMIRSENVTLGIFLIGGLAIIIMAVIISRKLVGSFKLVDMESELMNKQMVETGKLAAIGELAAGIAHEINNPVAIMIEEAGWVCDLLEDEKNISSAQEIERALTQVQTQGIRCKDITHKLLSFARQTDASVADVALAPLIREVAEISMQQARYAQVNFDLNLCDSIPEVRASVSELQQVFLNLINNSIQAMEETNGGTLSLSCGMENGQAFVSVADTGPGIPAANLGRIFDPFFTTKPVGKGSGLGLSICYGIIHQMGGEIDVKSTVGTGTEFTIRLPFKPSAN